MISILSEIESPEISLYGKEQKEDPLYDAEQAQDMVRQWKARIPKGRESRPSEKRRTQVSAK